MPPEAAHCQSQREWNPKRAQLIAVDPTPLEQKLPRRRRADATDFHHGLDPIHAAIDSHISGLQPLSGGGFGEWEPDLKARVAGIGSDLNISPMFFHDALDGVEAEAGAFSNSFGGEKGLEDVGLNFLGDAGAVVADFNDHASVFAVGADAKLAFAVHRVDGVIDEVGPDLVEFAAKGIHQQGNALIIALHRDSFFQLVIQDGQRGLQAFYNVDVLHRGLVHVGVFLDGANQVRYARGAALDFVEKAGDLDRGSDPDQRGASGLCVEGCEQRFDHFRLDVPSRKTSGQQPQVVLSVTAQQGINLIFQIVNGQRIGRDYIGLRERGFEFFDFRFLGGGEIALSQLEAGVPDFF